MALTACARNFTRVSDLSQEQLGELLQLAELLKAEPARRENVLRGKTIACIFGLDDEER